MADLFVHVPCLGAVTVFPVEHRRLSHVDEVGHQGYDNTHKGTQNPALSTVQSQTNAAPEVSPAPQSLDAVRVRDCIVDPVSAGELIIPDPFVWVEERAFALGDRVRTVRENVY